MDFYILLLIGVFGLLNNAMADWGANSPLILVRILVPYDDLKFPSVVRSSEEFHCTVYYSGEHENITMTYVYCPRSLDQNQYCNYSTQFSLRNYMLNDRPSETCDLPVKYQREPIKNMIGLHDVCTHNQITGLRYKFEYLLCDPPQNETIRIYEMCYKDDGKQIILGSYTIDTPRLLVEELLEDEQNFVFQFHTMVYPDNYFVHWHYIFQERRDYAPRSVLPPEWVAFGQQKKPLFNYANAAPMYHRLIPGWEKLMKLMKIKLSRMNEALHVTAGLLYLSVDGVPINEYFGMIDGNPAIKIPYAWCVLIYNENRTAGVAIIMHNRTYQVYRGEPNMSYITDENICSRNVCHLANIGEFFPEVGFNYMYCCHPSYIVEKFNLVVSGTELLQFPNA